MFNDTIAAIITAPGNAGVGIIRLSGDDAIEIGNKVYQGRKNLLSVPSHTINYGKILDNFNNKIIDEALFLKMLGPASFTGEDVLEIQCHGGIIPVKKVLELVLRNGARMAEPGEFSKRAFLNGKLDLSQAESIMDIVMAKTEKSLDAAVNQLEGNLSKMINEVRDELLKLIAFIEADIDFPEEDIERLSEEEQKKYINNIQNKINNLLETAQKGKIIREGLNVVIIGKPNVGKSSLLNALLNENRAIVTDIPGTTRDIIEEYINLKGIPLKIIDTAGIRETDNLVEKIGVDKAKELVIKADLILYVLDFQQEITEEDKNILNLIEDKPALILINKMDLGIEEKYLQKIGDLVPHIPIINISAKEKVGINILEDKIIEMFFAGNINIKDQILITNTRHVNALEKAKDHLDGALNSLDNKLPGDFIAIDIRSAWENLGYVTGDTLDEDILDQIFSQFCLGK